MYESSRLMPRDLADRTIQIVGTATRSFAEPILKAAIPGGDHLQAVTRMLTSGRQWNQARRVSPHDPASWIGLVASYESWQKLFRHKLEPRAKDLATRLRDHRNEFSHYEPQCETVQWLRSLLTTAITFVAMLPGGEPALAALAEIGEEVLALERGADAASDEFEAKAEGETGRAAVVAEEAVSAPPSLESLMLELDQEQRAIVRRFTQPGATGLLLGGEAGSGKTIVMLHAVAAVLGGKQPALPGTGQEQRVLFTTFTRSLVNTASHLLSSLLTEEQRRQVDVMTVASLARSLVPGDYEISGIDAPEVGDLAREILAEMAEEPDFSYAATDEDLAFLLEEVEQVILGLGLWEIEEYMGVERAGGRRRLTAAQRAGAWRFYERLMTRMQTEIDARRRLWGEVYRQAVLQARPQYDYVFVDEAQDLSPVELRLLASVAKDPQKVTIAIDRNQSIYGRHLAWSQIHGALGFQGRGWRMHGSHRFTREIETAVAPLFPGADPAASKSPSPHHGPRPRLVWHDDGDAWHGVINDYIKESMRAEGVGPDAVTVLCPTDAKMRAVAVALDPGLRPKPMRSRDFDIAHDGVKVTTIHAAKGLGFPVVVVFGVEEPLMGKWPSRESHEEARGNDRRLLFVACTRATSSLMVLASASRPSPHLADLDESAWEVQRI